MHALVLYTSEHTRKRKDTVVGAASVRCSAICMVVVVIQAQNEVFLMPCLQVPTCITDCGVVSVSCSRRE